MKRRWMNTEEASDHLGVSPRMLRELRELRRKRRIPYVKHGPRLIVYSMDGLDEYLSRHTVEAVR